MCLIVIVLVIYFIFVLRQLTRRASALMAMRLPNIATSATFTILIIKYVAFCLAFCLFNQQKTIPIMGLFNKLIKGIIPAGFSFNSNFFVSSLINHGLRHLCDQSLLPSIELCLQRTLALSVIPYKPLRLILHVDDHTRRYWLRSRDSDAI